ncbi:MAG: hypothetical protein ABSH38_07140 [Verrucomicrobiota bacterium]|jgi:hypothetical protein
MSRTGKIARLPTAIREQLNARIEQGEPSIHLVDWLNSLPSVNAVLDTYFAGRPVTDGNLSDWKHGGYKDWKAEQAAAAMFEKLCQTPAEKLTALQSGLIDQMATLYAAQLLSEMQKPAPHADDAARAKIWREFRQAFASLRRYQFATLAIQDRLKFQPIETEATESFQLTEDDKRRRVEHLLGVAGGPDANRFDVKTQTWSGPNAAVMNRQHRKLLLKAAKEAGIDLENETQNPDKSGEIRPIPAKSG